MKVFINILSIALVFISCKKETINDSIISMALPYTNQGDIDSIGMTYTLDTTKAPWNMIHGGINFHPVGNVKRIQAVSQGIVQNITISQDFKLNWQVDVSIRYNKLFVVFYTFYMDTPFQNDATTQRNEIFLNSGDFISQGDYLGNLFTVGNNAHLELSLVIDNFTSCPEPYFNENAISFIQNLIAAKTPGRELCYQ